MSDDIQEAMLLQLDATLLKQIDVEEAERETRRAHDNAAENLRIVATEAQRLRMALYALTGDKAGLGDANVANSRRHNELLREQR